MFIEGTETGYGLEVSELDYDGEVYVRAIIRTDGAAYGIYLNADARSALIKHLNVVEGKCAACPPREALAQIQQSSVEAVLNLAGEHAHTVEFKYAKPSGQLETRTLAVGEDGVTVTRDGHKIVSGWDIDRDEPRCYRLDRMTAGVLLRAV